MKRLYYLLSGLLMTSSVALAEDTVFTYAPAEGTKVSIGSGYRSENDLAIRINDPAYVGFEILGVSVNVPIVEGCSVDNIGKAWVTKALTVEQTTYKCVPDVMTVEGEIKNYGSEENPEYRLDVTFPESYLIPEEGIYVGYTLTTTALKNSTQKYPLEIITSSNPASGLFVHFEPPTPSMALAKHKAFRDLSASNMSVSTMRVFLRGSKAEYSAGIETVRSVFNAIQSDSHPVEVVISNSGSKEIDRIAYSFVCSDGGVAQQSGEVTLNTPIPEGESLTMELPFEVPSMRGDYDYALTLTKTNGEDNNNANRTTSIHVVVRPWLPRKRVLIEEGTGLWCKSCPSGYVTLKQVHDKYPDDVVMLIFHTDDSMQTIESALIPTGGGLGLSVDRKGGLGFWQNGIDNVVDYLAEFTPADIDVDLYWEDETRSRLKAVANLKFVDPAEEDQYRLAFALVEDEMSDPTWLQYNDFFDTELRDQAWYRTPYWDLFIGKGYVVKDLIFDDIALLFPDHLGIPNSVPALDIEQEYSYASVLDPAQAIGIYNQGLGKNLVKDKNKLRVVAILIDMNSGNVVNTASTCYAADIPVYVDTSGAGSLPADNAPALIAEEYYNTEGMRLAEQQKNGVTIVVRRYEDGSVKTAKILH